LAFALLFVSLTGVFAVPATARTEKHAAFVVDANSGAVLHNDDGDAIRHPASLTKMMTLYLTFEMIESGRLKMSDMVTMSNRGASVAPSKLDLKPGEQISVADAIKALVTKSANDVAVALAEKIGGTETNFVRLMNARARALGMTKTHFENPSGLPNDDHVSTAHDMATLALHLMDDYPRHYRVFSTHVFHYRGKSYRNHNTMLNTFAGVDGIKTGYTRASGFNLVTSVHRGKRHLIGVVFGGRTAAKRNAEMRTLLTKAFTRASTVKTRKPMLLARARDERKPAPRPTSRRPEPAPSQVADAESRETPIHVFKVRHVPIVTKGGTISADQTTDMQGLDGSDNQDTPPAAQENSGNAAAGFARPVAFAPPSEPMRPAPQQPMVTGTTGRPVNAAGDAPQRGLPPSTLNAQAWALQGQPNRAPAQYGQARMMAVRAAAGNYEVQIGAYGSIADAQRALSSVQDRAQKLLAGVASVTHPTTKNGHQIFRARFAGFNEDRATSTCTALRRKGVDCFVMAGD
jgi:D-alanyl-D-alanine carboxypeptidase